MKCPNCSFENRDDVKVCRVCGNVLINTISASDPPIKQSKYNDAPDEAIDDALSSLFGENEDDDLDAAAMARLLSKRRPQKKPDVITDEIKPQVTSEKEESTYNMRIIWLVSAMIIILLILFKTSWSSIPWKYNSDQASENTTSPITDSTSITTESTPQTTEIAESTETSNVETTAQTEPQTTTQATTQPPTQPTTEAQLEGFISTGGFSGGTQTSGQDVAFARYGLHDGYERLVFDIYEWVGGKPTDTVSEIGPYETSISTDGKTITINLNGAINAYAKQEALDLKGSKTLLSVTYDTPSTGERVQITLKFAEPVKYKVFNLKSAARLVVDFAK